MTLGWLTENGWPTCDVEDCDTNPIPGTLARIPLQRGIANKIMKAFAADIHWYIESLDNGAGYADEGGFTPSNSVGTSNHLGGTAMDLNWQDHPMGPEVPDPAAGWQWSEIVGGPEEPRVRELLSYYTISGLQLIWWGNDWNSPHDSMHFQMGYGTYLADENGNGIGPNPLCQTFIDRFINADGTSKFREMKKAQGPSPADVLQAATGLANDKIAAILPALQVGLRLAECTNPNRIAMFIAQLRHESDNFNTTVEYGLGQGKQYYPYCGRTWIQVTWESNYLLFGKWCVANGLITDSNQFVADYDSLADIKWAAIGGAWFWLAKHDGHNMINDDCDAGDVTAVTYTINGGYTDLAKRVAYYDQAITQGDALLTILGTGEDYLDMVAQSDWEALVSKVDDLHALLAEPVQSQSRYRTDGEGAIWTRAQMIQNDDGMIHEANSVERLAIFGSKQHIDLVVRNAKRGDPIAMVIVNKIPVATLTEFGYTQTEIAAENKANYDPNKQVFAK